MNAYPFDDYWGKVNSQLGDYYNKDRVYRLIKYYLAKYEQLKGKKHPKLKASQWDKVIKKFNVAHVHDMSYSRDYEIFITKEYIDQYFNDFENTNTTDHNILHFISNNILLHRGYNLGELPR